MDDEMRWGPWPGKGWTPVAWGAHVREDLLEDLGARLRAAQLVLPFWASFTGLTAAQLRGWWMPPLPPGLPLFVASGKADRIDRRGFRVCRHTKLPPWALVEGARVTSPPETILACARFLGLLDLIVLGDAALHAGDVTISELVAASRQRRRGAPRLRLAIPLMDGRAESIYESLLRLLHVLCDVPVIPQHLVVDAEGQIVARADLWIVGTCRLPEYDGGSHLTRSQQRRDLRRAGRIADAGYERRGYTKEDVVLAAAGILRDADRALGRPHQPGRIAAWNDLMRASAFSDSGLAQLSQRLGLGTENAEQTPA